MSSYEILGIVFGLCMFWAMLISVIPGIMECVYVGLIFVDKYFFNGIHGSELHKKKLYWIRRQKIDNEDWTKLTFTPLAEVGRFCFPYIIAIFFTFECICLFWLFDYLLINIDSVGISFSVCGSLIMFILTTGLLLLNRRFQELTEPPKTLKLLDRFVKIIVFVLFCYGIYNSFYDQDSIFHIFHEPITKSLAEAKKSFLLLFIFIFGIFWVGYFHICLVRYYSKKFSKIEKEKSDN